MDLIYFLLLTEILGVYPREGTYRRNMNYQQTPRGSTFSTPAKFHDQANTKILKGLIENGFKIEEIIPSCYIESLSVEGFGYVVGDKCTSGSGHIYKTGDICYVFKPPFNSDFNCYKVSFKTSSTKPNFLYIGFDVEFSNNGNPVSEDYRAIGPKVLKYVIHQGMDLNEYLESFSDKRGLAPLKKTNSRMVLAYRFDTFLRYLKAGLIFDSVETTENNIRFINTKSVTSITHEIVPIYEYKSISDRSFPINLDENIRLIDPKNPDTSLERYTFFGFYNHLGTPKCFKKVKFSFYCKFNRPECGKTFYDYKNQICIGISQNRIYKIFSDNVLNLKVLVPNKPILDPENDLCFYPGDISFLPIYDRKAKLIFELGSQYKIYENKLYFLSKNYLEILFQKACFDKNKAEKINSGLGKNVNTLSFDYNLVGFSEDFKIKIENDRFVIENEYGNSRKEINFSEPDFRVSHINPS